MLLELFLKGGAVGEAAVLGDGIVRQARLFLDDSLGLFHAQLSYPFSVFRVFLVQPAGQPVARNADLLSGLGLEQSRLYSAAVPTTPISGPTRVPKVHGTGARPCEAANNEP